MESYLAGPLTVNHFKISLSWTAAPKLQASALVERESGRGRELANQDVMNITPHAPRAWEATLGRAHEASSEVSGLRDV